MALPLMTILGLTQIGSTGIKSLLDMNKANKVARQNEKATSFANAQSALSALGNAPRQFAPNLKEFKPSGFSNFLGSVGTAAGLGQQLVGLQQAAADRALQGDALKRQAAINTGTDAASEAFFKDQQAGIAPKGLRPNITAGRNPSAPDAMNTPSTALQFDPMTVTAPRPKPEDALTGGRATGFLAQAGQLMDAQRDRDTQDRILDLREQQVQATTNATQSKMGLELMKAQKVAQAVMQDPHLFHELPAEEKSLALLVLPDTSIIKRQMSAAQMEALNETRETVKALADLEKLATDNAHMFGRFDVIDRNVPFIGDPKTASKIESLTDLLTRSVARLKEVGVLTDKDVDFYRSVFPQITDRPDIWKAKFEQVQTFIFDNALRHTSGLVDQGFGVPSDPLTDALLEKYRRGGR